MDEAVLREDMVDSLEHEAKGLVRSDRVGLAMRTVPRHRFFEDEVEAYADTAHSHRGSRVLAPSTVARLLEALAPEPGDDVLVVGVGVGYTAAVLAEIAGPRRVQGVEIARQLVWTARRNLADAGYDEVLVDQGDGARGLEAYAPYDRILLEAAAADPPEALLRQLSTQGRLVMPAGLGSPANGTADGGAQSIVAVDPDGAIVDRFGPCAFDPLLVKGEQAGALERNRQAREDREIAQREAQRRVGWEQDWIEWD